MNVNQEKKILETLKQAYPRRMRISSLSKKTGLSRSETTKEVAYLGEKGFVDIKYLFGNFYLVSATAAGIDYLAGKEKIIKMPEILYCPLTGSSCDKPLKMQLNVYFVAHAFTNEKKDSLRKAIENAFRKFELNPYYADEEIRAQHVACKICEKIRCSKFGIFDISDGNPNVMFELGIAWGCGKKALLITESGFEIPADLRGLDMLVYRSYKDLTKKLKTKIKSFVV